MLEKILYLYSSEKYTITTTLINVIIGIALFYIALFVQKQKKIPLKELYYATLSWGILGITIRFSADIFNIQMPLRLFFITPFIYIEIFLLALCFLYINRKIWTHVPIFISIPCLLFLIINANHFRFMHGLIIMIFTYVVYLFAKRRYSQKEFSLPITFQSFDGFTTFIATTYLAFYEEHLLANKITKLASNYLFTINNSGAWLFLLIKILIPVLLIEIIRKSDYLRENNNIKFVLWFIAFLGFLTGTRNLLNILFI